MYKAEPIRWVGGEGEVVGRGRWWGGGDGVEGGGLYMVSGQKHDLKQD